MTKNEAIEFLVTKLEKDEPVFILRGRDSIAHYAIARWLDIAEKAEVNKSKIESAQKVWLEFLQYFPVKTPD